jgi:hypothetical protein
LEHTATDFVFLVSTAPVTYNNSSKKELGSQHHKSHTVGGGGEQQDTFLCSNGEANLFLMVL